MMLAARNTRVAISRFIALADGKGRLEE